MIFEWGEDKASANVAKHSMSFEEALTVFGDPDSLTIFDDAHSDVEDRYATIGRSAAGRIVIVVYTERDGNIRLISARLATGRERRQYEQR